MKKKVICFNLSPVSPAVRAWLIDVNVVELDDDLSKEPIRHSCDYMGFLSVVSDKLSDLGQASTLSEHSILPDDKVVAPLLDYSGIAPLLDVLESFCTVEILPNGHGGFFVQAEIKADGDSFFDALVDA